MGVHVVVDIFINFVFGNNMFMVCVKPIIAMTIFISLMALYFHLKWS